MTTDNTGNDEVCPLSSQQKYQSFTYKLITFTKYNQEVKCGNY